MTAMTGRFPIEEITPMLACGAHPAKAVVGELVPIGAVSYRDGHDALGCNVVWQGPDGATRPFTRMAPGTPGLDQWHATVRPDAVGMWTFTVEAFSDPYLTWRNAVTKKIEAGQGVTDLDNDLAIGADVLDRAATTVPKDRAKAVLKAAAALRDENLSLANRTFPAMSLAELIWEHPVRELVTSGPPGRIWVDRKRALFSAWYEFFPRSEGAEVTNNGRPVKHGTFATAARRLTEIAKMGFDVVYLRRFTPSAGPTARGVTTPWWRARKMSARRGRSARPRAVTTLSTRGWAGRRTSAGS
jgi:starch synthase (maltosyl-transferring)